MVSANLLKEEAQEFCNSSINHLCKELVEWHSSGVLGEAPLFRELTRRCSLYYGLEHARKVAEEMVKARALRILAGV